MEAISLTCPNCGANITVPETGSRQFCFCEYCGSKITFADRNTTTIRYVDETRLREAELRAQVRLKELELQKTNNELYEQKVAVNRKFFRKRLLIYVIIGFAGMILGGMLASNNAPDWLIAIMITAGSIGLAAAFYGSIGHGIAMIVKRKRYKS